jgi:CHAT domain-containing protein
MRTYDTVIVTMTKPMGWIPLVTLCLILTPFSPLLLAAETPPSADELMQQALTSFQQGALEEALIAWKEAARLYRELGNTNGEIQALSRAAYVARSLGHMNQALQHQELALQLAQQTGDPSWIALSLSELGKTYLINRQYDAALEFLSQAADMAKTHALRPLSAAALNDLGIVRAAQEQFPEALAAFQESAMLAQQENLPLLLIRARINAARAAMRLKRFDEAVPALDEAGRLLSELPRSYDQADGFISLGLAYRELAYAEAAPNEESLRRSASLLQEAVAVSEQLGEKRLASYAYGHLGHLYETEYRFDEALDFTRRAIFAAQAGHAPESLYRWQWQRGRLLAKLGKLDEALSAYQQATATLQPIRAEVEAGAPSSLSSDRPLVRPLFFELADLLLRRAALTKDEKLAAPYLLAARNAIEAYKAAELRDYFRDDCVDQLQARITKLERVSASTVIIYPIMFSDRTELLVSFPQGMKRFPVAVPADMLTGEVRAFRRMLEKRTTREYLPHAQRLYDWLIRPLEEDLGKLTIDTLVFVPDGPFRTVPMAALHDGERFLIARYAVATSPGLDLTDPQPIDRSSVHLLSSGLTESVQGFPALPYVAEEISRIRSVFGGEQLLDNEFISSRLEGELKDGSYSILHIATHGQFAPEVNRSFLLTFDDKLTVTDLEKLVGFFRFRREPLELLTLSACQTGIGDDRAALGLAGIAVKAGARSALATLWFINDEASAELVSEFYRRLHEPAISKARALQLAQLKLLSDRVYEHPAYWSAFLLLNNWL